MFKDVTNVTGFGILNHLMIDLKTSGDATELVYTESVTNQFRQLSELYLKPRIEQLAGNDKERLTWGLYMGEYIVRQVVVTVFYCGQELKTSQTIEDVMYVFSHLDYNQILMMQDMKGSKSHEQLAEELIILLHKLIITCLNEKRGSQSTT